MEEHSDKKVIIKRQRYWLYVLSAQPINPCISREHLISKRTISPKVKSLNGTASGCSWSAKQV